MLTEYKALTLAPTLGDPYPASDYDEAPYVLMDCMMSAPMLLRACLMQPSFTRQVFKARPWCPENMFENVTHGMPLRLTEIEPWCLR